MRRVYSSPNSLMVDHLKLVLEGAGIECAVRNRHLSAVAGYVPSPETWTELCVLRDEDQPRAEEIVADALSQRAEGGQLRRCERCGEWLEPQFGSCWKCASPPANDRDDGLPSPLLEPLTPSGSWLSWALWAVLAFAALYTLRSYGR